MKTLNVFPTVTVWSHFHVIEFFFFLVSCPFSPLASVSSSTWCLGGVSICTRIIIHQCVFVSIATLDIYAHDYSIQNITLMLQSTIKYIFSVFLHMCLLTGGNCLVSPLESSSWQIRKYNWPHWIVGSHWPSISVTEALRVGVFQLILPCKIY